MPLGPTKNEKRKQTAHGGAAPRKRKGIGGRSQSCQTVTPDDSSDYVFLPRAVQILGQARFKERWAPELVELREPAPHPEWSDEFIEEIDWDILSEVAETLRGITPGVIPSWQRSSNGSDCDDDWALDPKLWAIAIEARNARIAQIVTAKANLAKAKADLVDKLRRGEIETFLRPIAGGEYAAADADIWNFENWAPRLLNGRIDPEAPYARPEDGWGDGCESWSHFIFVGRRDLERIGHIEAACPDLYRLWPHLSPLMQVALRVAEEIRKAGVQPSKDSLVERLHELADQENATLSKTLARRMVTVIRLPGAIKGVKQIKIKRPKSF